MSRQTDSTALKTVAAREAARVEEAIRDDLARALDGCDPLLAEVLEYGLLGGGKRIRPLLAVLCSSLCGRRDPDLYRLGAALEYLHVATLIHDDVIDHARTRRGAPSVTARYGMAVAILAGDWLHARSMRLVGELTGQDGLRVFCRATGAMVDGEFLQLRWAGRCKGGRDAYFAVIDRKTAALISSTCRLGAIYAGADSQRQEALEIYGQRLGTAFQIIDDLLDYLGDQDKTGKKVGNDFIEGKVTLPLLLALDRLPPDGREELRGLIRGDRRPEQIGRLRELVEQGQGFARAREEAEAMITEGMTALTPFAGDEHYYPLLEAIGRYVLAREK